mmetsp:Transcript_1901/g.5546  ORF Transcript_1901/g.5546 Transcript_1901/m.5546 type:complete len:264 (-) Transcript_1901:1310-2101(-)
MYSGPGSFPNSRSFSLATSFRRGYSMVGVIPSALLSGRLRLYSSLRDSLPGLPTRTSFSRLTNLLSACRKTLVSSTGWNLQAFQRGDSKAKVAVDRPLETGGSCRKSPTQMTWMPPNGFGWSSVRPLGPGMPLVQRATRSTLSNRSAEIMETSSMMSVPVALHRSRTSSLALSILIRAATSLFPNRMPAKLWMVHPPTLTAAIPVLAVICTTRSPAPFRCFTICSTRNDFPTPAFPVMKRFFPARAASMAFRCSSDSCTSCSV